MSIPEIDKQIEQSDALSALFERMRSKGWPPYSEDPELCMERAREFIDCAERIYPRGITR